MRDSAANDIDSYLAGVPEAGRVTLEGLRQMVMRLVPDSVESISYGMPTFKYRGRPLFYFGAAKSHLAHYGTSAGTVRFQPGEPPAESVVKKLLDERMAEIDAALARKRKKPGATGA